MSSPAIPDRAERRRIDLELDTNLLVEAGAGSGKTTKLLDRMIALIGSGQATVAQIAAVTFTRKAAAELREGFQARLEAQRTKERNDPRRQALFDDALDDIDRGFVGTIHAFCGRLLREHPIEARLDPSFREIFGPEEKRLCAQAWGRHLERLTTDGDPSLARLREIHIEASKLFTAYRTLVDQPDVAFSAVAHEPPAVDALRDELAALVDEAALLLPSREPDGKWGNLQKKIRRLQQTRWNDGWSDDAVFLDALEIIVGHGLKPTYKKWGEHSDTIRPIERRLTEFAAAGGAAEAALQQWHAYRYRIVLEFVRVAADAYEAERLRQGLVTFNDLLLRAAQLLRDSKAARRELASRFPYLLVDEFQDTDPVQAEILFLLAADDVSETDWQAARPRPGSLFVVGDPKQSIYRFRRADIEVYNQVRERIERCGAVVSLSTNFRSQPPIECFVNGVFKNLLPAEASAHQAAFAELNVHNEGSDHQGVFWYEVPCDRDASAAVAAADAPIVASWIASRIDSGERTAGDFMILTYRKGVLSNYGVELEQRGVPFQITGAGVDIAEELRELITVLRALADPHDPVSTVAVLVGLFFGIDHEALLAHRLEHEADDQRRGAPFDLSSRAFGAVDDSASEVAAALHRLHRWWRDTQRLPADVVIGNLVDELGLFPYLAAGEAGGSNAGALAYVLGAVRAAGVAGDTSLATALEALDEALDADEVEAPLQPGRDDVVRVMNLHKAKGLEANVVILAHPSGAPDYPIESVVRRPENGPPYGAFVVQEKSGYSKIKLAAPLDWETLAAGEQPFEDAEQTRLLYVAATRAREELLIGYCAKSEKKSPWQPFYPYRESLCEPLALVATPAAERAALEVPASTLGKAADALRAERASRAAASYEITSVTKLVKHDASIFTIDDGSLGRSWGNAVHEALEAAGRGNAPEQLAAICRTALLDNDLPVGTDGEPEDLEDLIRLVSFVGASETWERARQARRRLIETPFAAPQDGPTGRASIVEGVIDLAFAEDDGWVIVDYKTDADAANREARRAQYRAQVDAYARLFEQITSETVKERQLLWLGAELETESW